MPAGVWPISHAHPGLTRRRALFCPASRLSFVSARARVCYQQAMSTAPPSQPAAKRRRGRKPNSTISRSSIVAAAIELVREAGPEALTTGRIAKRMDIVQSGFYAHFASMDDCIAALEARIEAELRRPIAERMGELRRTNPSNADTLTGYYDGLFDLVDETGPLMELFLRFRRDRSKLGAVLDACEARLIDDLTSHLDAIMPADTRAPGLAERGTKGRVDACRVMARFLVQQSFQGVELWWAGALDRDTAARLLAEQTAHFGISAAAAGLFAPQPG